MADRSRILVVTGTEPASMENAEFVRAATLSDSLALLNTDHFAGIFLAADDRHNLQQAKLLLQNETILESLAEGVALVQPDLRIVWANRIFEKWCGGPVVGREFFEALGAPAVLGPDLNPAKCVARGTCIQSRLQRRDQYLDMRLTPILDAAGKVQQLIGLCRDITSEVRKQLKLDALHQAGRELACLQSDLRPEDRIDVLKHNIRQLTHNLLHYDVIEIRLLDPKTGLLKPLFAEGMTESAAARVLFAKKEGNGVTGYVAATGETYVCNDAACDPLYIEGSVGARSSLTIALRDADQAIIGTFNVESPQLGGFSPQDVQFAEIFCRELSSALHTLDLLVVEQQAKASESIEQINQEISIPVDEILAGTTALLDRCDAADPEVAALKKMLANARLIKGCVLRVGVETAPREKPLMPGSAPPCQLGLRVLVIEPDERHRKSAHSILGKFGCVVETVPTAREGLALARHGAYDAMLADIRLPDMTGHDIFLALRKAQPSANVILMTEFGYDPTHAIVKSKKDGLQHTLYKPFNEERMLNALRNPDGKA